MNQTLVRSINTSIVALLPVTAILVVGAGLLGAGTLKDLALALFVGMAAGTYSSIFIATPVAVPAEGAAAGDEGARGPRRAARAPAATPRHAVAQEPAARPTATAVLDDVDTDAGRGTDGRPRRRPTTSAAPRRRPARAASRKKNQARSKRKK